MREDSRFTLWIIFTSSGLTAAAGVILAPVLNLIREGLGVGAASAGLIITTHALSNALFSPLFGTLIDRIGTKKPFVLGLLLYGLAGGSGIIIVSYWTLIMSRVLLGIGLAAVFNSITVMVLNLYEGTERDRIMGWLQSTNILGAIVWPLVSGFLGRLSWHLPFAVYALGIPLSFLGWITTPDIHKEKQPTGENSLLSIFRNHSILFFIYSLFFLLIILSYVVLIFLPQLLGEMGISNPVYISLFITVMAISAGVTSFMYGKIKPLFSYKMLVLISFGLWTVTFTTISQGFSTWIIAASVALCGISQGILTPAVMVWVGETVSVSFRGRIVSYLTAFGSVGQFLSALVFGPVALFLGFDGVFLVAGGLCAALFLLFLIGMKK